MSEGMTKDQYEGMCEMMERLETETFQHFNEYCKLTGQNSEYMDRITSFDSMFITIEGGYDRSEWNTIKMPAAFVYSEEFRQQFRAQKAEEARKKAEAEARERAKTAKVAEAKRREQFEKLKQEFAS